MPSIVNNQITSNNRKQRPPPPQKPHVQLLSRRLRCAVQDPPRVDLSGCEAVASSIAEPSRLMDLVGI